MVKWSLLKGLLCWSQHQTPCEQFQPIPHKTGMPWQGEGSSKTSWASGHPWTTPLTVAEEQPHRDRLRSIQPTIIFLTAAKSVASVEECKNRANVWWLFSSTASSKLSHLMSQLPKHPMGKSSNAKFFIIWKKQETNTWVFSYVAPSYFLPEP